MKHFAVLLLFLVGPQLTMIECARMNKPHTQLVQILTTVTYSHKQSGQVPTQFTQGYSAVETSQNTIKSIDSFVKLRIPELQSATLASVTKKAGSPGNNYLFKYTINQNKIYIQVWDDDKTRQRQIRSLIKAKSQIDSTGKSFTTTKITKKIDENLIQYAKKMSS